MGYIADLRGFGAISPPMGLQKPGSSFPSGMAQVTGMTPILPAAAGGAYVSTPSSASASSAGSASVVANPFSSGGTPMNTGGSGITVAAPSGVAKDYAICAWVKALPPGLPWPMVVHRAINEIGHLFKPGAAEMAKSNPDHALKLYTELMGECGVSAQSIMTAAASGPAGACPPPCTCVCKK